MSPATEKMVIYHVIYSSALGIYLGGRATHGQGNWSFTNPGMASSAPAFTDEEAAVEIAELRKVDGHTFGLLSKRMVHPDRPGNHASREACSSAGLPIWMQSEEVPASPR